MSEEQEESEEKFVVLPSDGAALKLDPESRCVENVRGDSFFFFPKSISFNKREKLWSDLFWAILILILNLLIFI